MRGFTCGNCSQLVFFENSLCLRCSAPLGLVPSRRDLIVLDGPAAPGLRRCANAALAGCNWMVEDGDHGPLCRSCRLTRTRPADADRDGLRAFAKAEAAKRRLLFQLLDLELAVDDDLAFDLLVSRRRPVLTGHEDGLITIDLAESDDSHREQRRAELGEPYRTMLGHFRHEIGHYFWPQLIERGGALEPWRERFGDERLDYEGALKRHYQQGPARDWRGRYVSAYATMHPWEDWAETFAHYLHIRDTLQTATAFGIVIAGHHESPDASPSLAPVPDANGRPLEALIREWLPLSYALNAVNRSMGRDDLYPFTLAPIVIDKLSFVDDCVRSAQAPSPR